MGRRPEINGRELLVDAALRLFAEEGIEGVSIRAVNREAGLGPASMHYHFGTKDALVQAVLHMHGDVVVDRLRTRAQELLDTDEPVAARDLVVLFSHAYLDLMSEHPDTGHNWVRLVSQLSRSEPERVINPGATKLIHAAAAKVYPEASPKQVDRAMRMCFLLLVTQLAQLPSLGRGKGVSPVDLDLLIDFLSGGLHAALQPQEETVRTRLGA